MNSSKDEVFGVKEAVEGKQVLKGKAVSVRRCFPPLKFMFAIINSPFGMSVGGIGTEMWRLVPERLTRFLIPQRRVDPSKVGAHQSNATAPDEDRSMGG